MTEPQPPVPFASSAIDAPACLSEAWARVKPQYGVFLGITAVGLILGSVAPLGILMGPMMCGIYLAYREQALGRPVTFDRLFKGFDQFLDSFNAALLMIGASLVIALPLVLVIFVSAFASAAGADQGSGLAAGGCLALALGCLLLILASALVSILFSFAFPLIADRKLPGLEAVKLSFRAAWANLGGLLLLALLTALLNVAGLLCCYVGVFLLLPVTLGAHWICYERVFGVAPEA